jgi:WD40 repeat protein
MDVYETYLTLDENTASWWEDPITDIIQLSDGNVASCGLSSVDVQIWSPDTGSLIKELTFSQDSFVRKMALLKNGMLACGGYDGSLKICDPTTGIIVNELKGHESSIVSLSTLSDGSIVSYSNNGKIKIWNSQNGELEANASADFIETLDEDNAGELAVLSDDYFILTRNRGPIWNMKKSEWKQELGFDIGDYFYCAKNKIIGVDENEQLYSLNAKLGKRIISRNTRFENNSITKIAALSDQRIITGYSNGLVKIWEQNNHVTINLFNQGFNIDNIYVMNDGRIITFAETCGKIWSI